MHFLKIVVTSILVTSSFFASAQSKESVIIKTNIYCDHCKQCESCGPRLYSHLMDTPGVRKVKIDGEKATIEVTYNADKVDPKAIRQAINNAGFDADDQAAPPEAVAKLDQCCRKG